MLNYDLPPLFLGWGGGVTDFLCRFVLHLAGGDPNFLMDLPFCPSSGPTMEFVERARDTIRNFPRRTKH